MLRPFVVVALGVLSLCLFAFGCVEVVDDAGQAEAQITSVPNQVNCIRIDIDAPGRTVEKKFTVTAGQSATLTMNGLPTGQVTFVGDAFSQACASVTTATAPTWSSDPTPAYLGAGVMQTVSLVFKKTSNVTVSVDFVQDAGVPGPSPTPTPGPMVPDLGASDLAHSTPSPTPTPSPHP